jgi:hypothetical protein
LLRQCVFSVIFVISVANQLPFLGLLSRPPNLDQQFV